MCGEQNWITQINPDVRVVISVSERSIDGLNLNYLISSALRHQIAREDGDGKKPAAPRRDRIRASAVLINTTGMLSFTQHTQRVR